MDTQKITPAQGEGQAEPPKVIPSPIDFTKPVRTKLGFPVRIIAIDHVLHKPVIGVVEAPGFSGRPETWGLNGTYMDRQTGGLDLENVAPAHPEFDAWFATVAETIELDPETSTLTIARLAWDAARRII